MRFMIIVKATADSEAGVMPPPSLLAQMGAFHEELARAGVLLDGAGLRASAHGWRVAIGADGQRRVVEGPFGGTGELIAGYTLIQVRSREEAIEWSSPPSCRAGARWYGSRFGWLIPRSTPEPRHC